MNETELNESLYVWQMGGVDLLVSFALIVSHPICRLIVRAVTLAGALSAIVSLARDSKVARWFMLATALILTAIIVTGCASPTTTWKGKEVATSEKAPVTGVYCETSLASYQTALRAKLQCLDCEMPEFSRLADKYDECVLEHGEDTIIVNPFNRIRDFE